MKKLRFISSLFIVFAAVFCCLSCEGGCNGCDKGKSIDRHRYEITAEYSDGVITASETVYYYNNTESEIAELKFNLYANAFRKDAKYTPVTAEQRPLCYYDGVDYGYISILGVYVSDEEVGFEITGRDENVLKVPLEVSVYPLETVQVTVNFKVKLAKVMARTGICEKTVNIANWYPVLCVYDNGFVEYEYYSTGDPFYSECSDYSVSLTIDDTFLVASSGVTVSSKRGDNKITYNFEASNVRDFAMVLSKEFDHITVTDGGVEVNYYFYKDSLPEKTVKTAVLAIKTFSKLFGKYPYAKLDVAETRIFAGGMEYPCLAMISDDLNDEEREEVVIHETAHQWWYAAVGNDEVSYAFLDEGLTEYSVILFYENNPEYGKTRTEFIKTAMKSYTTYCSVYEKLFGEKNTSMMRKLYEFSSDYEYVNIAYMKGALMFDFLRQSVGDVAFYKGLKKYYSDYSFKNATPYDLAGVYEKSGCKTNGFFESWFSDKVVL